MNLRKTAYFAMLSVSEASRWAGTTNVSCKRIERAFLRTPPRELLIELLSHCKQSVPYYAEAMREMGDSFYEDPEEYLRRFPILTRDTLRSRFDELKSTDLAQRKWYFNSTVVRRESQFSLSRTESMPARSGAISLLYSKLVGREIGESQAYLWGSERDIVHGSEGWKARFVNKLTNTTFLNAYRMTPDRMREFIAVLNIRRPS